ncbi:unnamed protein product [Brassica oleracea var. botrytis]|uniref:(rape) hypothetical protein n=2 Tax=Brassica TaxID=3705 RepID=A0A816QIJ6_BRANA|nr:unnamed protein product [Brassica napus]
MSIVSGGKSLQLMQHIPSMSLENSPALASNISGELENGMDDKDLPVLTCSERFWYKLLVSDVHERRAMEAKSEHQSACYVTGAKEEKNGITIKKALQGLFCHENPVVSVSKMDLERNTDAWNVLNLSHNYCLPSLNDESLLSDDFEGSGVARSEYISSQDDTEVLETLFPFPTLLPSFQPKLRMSELLPYQKNSTLLSRVLCRMLKAESMDTPLLGLIMQECFTIYIRTQEAGMVYHTAWRELCEAMAKAGSLEEVIYVHETYLLSIQRQCFVVQEKLTLSSGGAASTIEARCEMEIEHIEKQFEDCIAFLLRVLSSKLNVGHFPHLADLVTRINYNYHYMPDTGSSISASGAETKSSRTLSAKSDQSDKNCSDRFEGPIMFALSKVLRRSQRLRLGACTNAVYSKQEIPSGERSFFTLQSHSFVHDQQLEPLPRVHHMSSMSKRLLSSSAGTKSDQEEDDDLEDGFSELENSKSGQESTTSSSDESDVDEGKLSADEEEELELDLTETDDSRKTLEKKQSELFKAIVSAGGLSVGSALDKWVEEEGNEISRTDVAKAMLQLRRRRMYGRALQMSEWLEANKKIEMNERDYASRLDLIVKTRGLEKGEAYVDKIPKSFRGEVMYRTLLANCVVACNVKKSELVFNRMKDLGFPRSGFTCDQMLLLYKRVDRKKISDVLLLMEKENVKPSLLTYKILIDVKGSSNDIKGMEQVVETMKDEGVEPDFNTQAIIARHYSVAGLKEKAESVLKEMEGESLEANRRAFKDLLSIYASLGREDEVRRVWKICESKPRFEESLSAIQAFGKLDKVQEAEEIFEKVIKMDRRVSSNTFSVLLRVYVDHKMLSKGKDLVKRMAESGCRIEASTWDALIRLYVEAGEVEKADSLLSKASKQSHTKLMMSSFMYIMDEYAKRGDVHNTEKIFQKMREVGYTSRLRQFQALMQGYSNAKAPAYGMRDRMKADNIFPNKAMAAQLAQGDPFKKTAISDILD